MNIWSDYAAHSTMLVTNWRSRCQWNSLPTINKQIINTDRKFANNEYIAGNSDVGGEADQTVQRTTGGQGGKNSNHSILALSSSSYHDRDLHDFHSYPHPSIIMIFIPLNLTMNADTAWHRSSGAFAFSQPDAMAQGGNNDEDEDEDEDEGWTEWLMAATYTLNMAMTTTQVVGVSPETGEAIRSRVRNLEELKVAPRTKMFILLTLIWFDYDLSWRFSCPSSWSSSQEKTECELQRVLLMAGHLSPALRREDLRWLEEDADEIKRW